MSVRNKRVVIWSEVSETADNWLVKTARREGYSKAAAIRRIIERARKTFRV